jgi:hypothetical protein
MTTRSQNMIFKLSKFTDGRVKYPPQALTTSIASNEEEPTCFSQASKHPAWLAAMNVEFDAFLKNGTWSLVPSLPSMNIVASKWVFRIKRIVNGEIFIFFLSVEATWHNDDLHLSQQRYIHDLLTKTNMLLAKPIATPMSASSTLSCFEGYTITDPTQYRSTVGSLQYLSLTRPDIAFAVNKVSQFMQDPRDTYWSAVKRILRYLKSTISHTFSISKNSTKYLTAYSDSNWASCPDDRRSTSGYCVLGKNILSWSSKKQPTVSRSSTESEYRAIANTAVELTWIQTLLRELGVISPEPPILYCDNIGATYLASNPIYHAWTKHIEIDYHFVRDMVAKKLLKVCFISGKDQLADILTKLLVAARFIMFRFNLNVHPPTSSLRGRIGLDLLSENDKCKVLKS